MILNALKTEYFKYYEYSYLASHLKLLTPKQMLQRLPIALTQVKAGNTSEDSLN